MIIDAHPHIYSCDKARYPAIDDPWEPGEPAEVADLKSRMDAAGVERAVFIQTSTYYGWDNRYVMDSARHNAAWATGVMTVSPDDPAHLDVLSDAVENHSVRGLRGTPDRDGVIGSANVRRLWAHASELGIVVNCMVLDDLERAPEIEQMADQLGDLPIVIDHCFMLNASNLAQRFTLEAKLAALDRLAIRPNVYAKLTPGTHGSGRVYPHEDMRLKPGGSRIRARVRSNFFTFHLISPFVRCLATVVPAGNSGSWIRPVWLRSEGW